MQTDINIKGITIGSGQPVICLPVVSHTKEDIIKEITQYVDMGASMIEWRVDYFDELRDDKAVAEVLDRIKDRVKNTILLFTFRSKKQGGAISYEESGILHLNEIAAASGVVDIIDLEFFEASCATESIRQFQDLGVKVIASHHDFEKTPDDEIVDMILRKMKQGGADIVKFAAYAKDELDVLRMLNQTALLKREFPNLPIVTMTMGPKGSISRMCGEVFGSCITFGAGFGKSAPGQIPFDKLRQALSIVHESLGE